MNYIYCKYTSTTHPDTTTYIRVARDGTAEAIKLNDNTGKVMSYHGVMQLNDVGTWDCNFVDTAGSSSSFTVSVIPIWEEDFLKAMGI